MKIMEVLSLKLHLAIEYLWVSMEKAVLYKDTTYTVYENSYMNIL